MQEIGTLTSWNDERGFGFITPRQGGQNVFVHISAFPPRRRPCAGEELRYTVSSDERGRPRTLQVEFMAVPECHHLFRWTPNTWVALSVVLVFFAVLLFASLSHRLPLFVFPLYALLSGALYAQYLHDKKAALQDRWRTPEKQLHVFSLLGGWPGGLVAQQGLRHKSQKLSFRAVYWLTVALNLVALAFLLMNPFS